MSTRQKIKKKETTKTAEDKTITLPGPAHAIAAIGPETERVILDYFRSHIDSPLFKFDYHGSLNKLAKAFNGYWTDVEASKVLTEYLSATEKGRKIDITALSRWVLSHPNDARAVLDCMSVEPPQEIDIIQILSRAGSQKLVFLATWRLTQRQVVLKKLTGPPEVADRIMARELQPHPLSMKHDNIIETHLLKNEKGEPFLVEKRLPFLLNDHWDSGGVHEAANLFYDIAKALQFLHSMDLIHGDVKPDNIGKDGEDYVLLDFGICRPKEAFIADATATGSLRTRAPELIESDKYKEQTEKVDIWALGATVYNALVGRFPLFDKDEKIPRVSEPEERDRYESLLLTRIKTEWDKRVDLSLVPESIRNILRMTLEKDQNKRSTASDLIKTAETELAAFLRTSKTIRKFSPSEELQQLVDFLPDPDILNLMPISQKDALKKKLTELKSAQGFDVKQIEQVNKLLHSLK
jgi:serine/threonine protein kinase